MGLPLPVEVWCQIADALPQPTINTPWPADLGALAHVNVHLRGIALRSILTHIYVVNPRREATFDLAGKVAYIASLLERTNAAKTLCPSVRTLLVDSRTGQGDSRLDYIDFLTAITPIDRILAAARQLTRVVFRRISLSPTVHAALYNLRGLKTLEIDQTYVSPPPEKLVRTKLTELRTLVIRKQSAQGLRDDTEAQSLVAFVRAAPNLWTLHADEPVLMSLVQQRRRLPIRVLIVTVSRDMRALLRCCPDLVSIEFSCIPISSIHPMVVPKLERFRGPLHGVVTYVPGRPVQHIDIISIHDADIVEGALRAIRSATAPTTAFRMTIATRGSVEYRTQKLAILSELKELRQLVIDSDLVWQTTEEFARSFTDRLGHSFSSLERLEVLGGDHVIMTLMEHQQQRILSEHRDPRLVSHWRAMMANNPPQPAAWEEELAQLWGERCPDLRSISWGLWNWVRTTSEDGVMSWVPHVRNSDAKLLD